MEALENVQSPVGWEPNKGHEVEGKSKEEEQETFNRVSFGGERILHDFNGAEVAIVPMEDYVLLEAFDSEN